MMKNRKKYTVGLFYRLFGLFLCCSFLWLNDAGEVYAAKKSGIVIHGEKRIRTKTNGIELTLDGKRLDLDLLWKGKNVNKGVRWLSKNKDIIKISRKGKIRAIGTGRTAVVAKYKGKRFVMTIHVKSEDENDLLTVQQIGYSKLFIKGTELSGDEEDYKVSLDEDELEIKKVSVNAAGTEVILELEEELDSGRGTVTIEETEIPFVAEEERIKIVNLLGNGLSSKNTSAGLQYYVSFEIKNQFGEVASFGMDEMEVTTDSGYASIDEKENRVWLSGLSGVGNGETLSLTLTDKSGKGNKAWNFNVLKNVTNQDTSSTSNNSVTELIPLEAY